MGSVPEQIRAVETWRMMNILGSDTEGDGGEAEVVGGGRTSREIADKIRIEAEYFGKNAGRMRYPKFRRQHLFVGSGVIEAGCRTVVGSRFKQSGMFWSVPGANSVLALRCCILNNRLQDYWDSRRAA